jgi:hypothetical protein
MIIKRYDKTRKCIVYDIRLLNEFGKLQYFACGHRKKTTVREYQEKLRKRWHSLFGQLKAVFKW